MVARTKRGAHTWKAKATVVQSRTVHHGPLATLATEHRLRAGPKKDAATRDAAQTADVPTAVSSSLRVDMTVCGVRYVTQNITEANFTSLCFFVQLLEI